MRTLISLHHDRPSLIDTIFFVTLFCEEIESELWNFNFCFVLLFKEKFPSLNFQSNFFLLYFQYPELNPMIMRRFKEPGDVEKAFELVHKSQGLEQTRFLARKHCLEAIKLANKLAESPYQKGLTDIMDLVLNRMK